MSEKSRIDVATSTVGEGPAGVPKIDGHSCGRVACAAAVTLLGICAAPRVGFGVIKPVAATSGPSVVVPPAPADVAPPVEVVLSHAVLQAWQTVGQAPVALPISFGRPVAPEDEASPPPARWHHQRWVRHAGYRHVTATQPAPASDDMAGLAPSELGGATAQGDDDGAE